MTKKELIAVCIHEFGTNFAKTWCNKIINNNALPVLWELIKEVDEYDFSKTDKDKIKFRASYILEYVYMKQPEAFQDYIAEFFELMPRIKNASMNRHFSKIACHIIKNKKTIPENMGEIVDFCFDHLIDSKVKIAVKNWLVHLLLLLKNYDPRIPELMPDVLNILADQEPTPGILVVIRNAKQKLSEV